LVAERSFTRYVRAYLTYDRTVCAGDIRLLPAGVTPGESRFLYVAVLSVRRENFTSVVAPFSSYSVPACKDEWLTGLESEPLKVLQFWNAQPVATRDLVQSWKTGELDEGQLSRAQLLYRHAIDGTWPQGFLREQVGLAILNSADERLAYQDEELALFAPLRGRLFGMMQRAEESAKRRVVFAPSSIFVRNRSGDHRFKELERLAADSGEVQAEVVILTSDGGVKRSRAGRDADPANRTVIWRIRDEAAASFLLPGLPVCLYARGARRPLVARGATMGDGTDVYLKAETGAAFARMLAEDGLWIIIGDA
jgi:hypothetical protein